MNYDIFWVCVMAYGAHIMEEYILDWKSWVDQVSKIVVEWPEFFVTNAVVIITGICCAMIGDRNLYLSLMFPALMLINAWVHIIPTIVYQRFSPGVLTAIVLFLPLSVWTFYQCYRTGTLTIPIMLCALFGALLMMLYPVFLQRVKMMLNTR